MIDGVSGRSHFPIQWTAARTFVGIWNWSSPLSKRSGTNGARSSPEHREWRIGEESEKPWCFCLNGAQAQSRLFSKSEILRCAQVISS